MAETVLLYCPTMDPRPWMRALEDALPDYDVRLFPGAADPEAVTCVIAFNPPPGFFAPFRNLRIVINLGAGVDGILAHQGLPDVPIVRLVDPAMSRLMLSYILFAVLRYVREFPAFERAQRDRRWQRLPVRPLDETTVGVLGLGELGGLAAAELARLGLRVLGFSRTATEIEGVRCLQGEAAFEGFLRESSILVVMLPLTPSTRGLLDSRRLALLPHGAAVINVARGPIVDEAALIDALRTGALSGATLDVFESEPLPEDHPFWTMEQVLITPHLASMPVPDSAVRRIAETLGRLRAGEALPDRVDRTLGY